MKAAHYLMRLQHYPDGHTLLLYYYPECPIVWQSIVGPPCTVERIVEDALWEQGLEPWVKRVHRHRVRYTWCTET